METILSIKNLNKSFGSKHIIKNASFDVYAGEIFGFLGPNGSGKTTTIKMIMGFLFPDSGDITICGLNVKKDYEKAMNLVGGMNEYVKCMNDENAYMAWIMIVPDEATEEDLQDIAEDDEMFQEVVELFNKLIKRYGDDLYLK